MDGTAHVRVVLKDGESLTHDELIEYLTPRMAKWWLPSATQVIDEVPKTSTGKFFETNPSRIYLQTWLSSNCAFKLMNGKAAVVTGATLELVMR